MKLRLPDWRSVRAFIRLRLAALASSANGQLAKVLRPKVARALAVLIFFSVVAVAAHAAAGGASVTLYAPPNDLGLIGYWPFDSATTNFSTGKTADLSGNNNTGTMVNMTYANLQVPGKLGQALSFDGATGYVTIPSNLVNNNENNISVSVWFRTSSDGVILGYQTATYPSSPSSYDLALYVGNNEKLYAELWTRGVNPIGSSGTVNDGKWHLATFTTSGGNQQSLYLDGALVGTLSGTISGFGGWGNQLGLGYTGGGWASTGNGSWFFFKGSLDDARMYNRALSATEVQQMYDAGLPGVDSATRDASPTSLVTNGLVGYWTFDGANTNWYTDTTADVSGKGNTGTLVGMSTTTSPVLGRFGQALQFSGSQSINVSGVNIANQSFTISAWTKTSSVGSGQAIVSQGPGGGNQELQFAYRDGGSFIFGFWNDDLVISTSVNTKWHYWTGTYNATTGLRSLYEDGALVGSNTASSNYQGYGALTIGNGFWGGWHGILDDVRIYNRALSATEVKQLHNAGAIGATIDTAPAQALSGGGLVGYWPFDGNKMNWASNLALDASGNGNNGTLENMTPANAVMGKIGQALSFNGTSQYVSVPDSTNLHFGTTGKVTFSAWVKFNGWYSGNCLDNMIMMKGTTNNGSDPSAVGLQVEDTGTCGSPTGVHVAGFFVANNTGSGLFDVNGTTNISLGQWHFFTGTFDGSTVRLYEDGVLSASTAFTGTFGNNTNILTIGEMNYGGYNYWVNGSIDDVRIYNRALSATEVRQLYNLGR